MAKGTGTYTASEFSRNAPHSDAEYEGGESELTCSRSLRTSSSSTSRGGPDSDCEAGVGGGSVDKTFRCFASSEGEAAGVT